MGSSVAVGSMVPPGGLLNTESLRSSVTVARPTEILVEAPEARLPEDLDGETEIELSENKCNLRFSGPFVGFYVGKDRLQ